MAQQIAVLQVSAEKGHGKQFQRGKQHTGLCGEHWVGGKTSPTSDTLLEFLWGKRSSWQGYPKVSLLLI